MVTVFFVSIMIFIDLDANRVHFQRSIHLTDLNIVLYNAGQFRPKVFILQNYQKRF